ncbi:DNA (cytosine-5-)-methyltransferase [Candidatus Saccharibacteria bacterium]|nr:DNA (cytosine-5-)-methyltransferase [Candidatus Saccharibacteria bacterium]
MGNEEIKIVELFAGVGGFRVGFERSSSIFKTVWANQWEPGQAGQWAYKCYVKNFGSPESCSNEDIATVINKAPKHDLLCGGFPCQDYSVAHSLSSSKGIEGKKGVLWWSINDIIKLRHPNYVFLENVDRLLKSPAKQRGRDFGIILRCLMDEGYVVEWRVINAAEYGYAQRRRRTFILGYKKGTKLYNELKKSSKHEDGMKNWILSDGVFGTAFPVKKSLVKRIKESDISSFKDLVDLTDNFSMQFNNAGAMVDGKILSIETTPIYEKSICLSKIVEKKGVDEHYFIPAEKMDKWKYLKGSKKIERVSNQGYKYTFSEGAIAFPDPLDKPARTMLTSEGTLNRSTHVIEDPKTKKLRILTPIECERINGFPDNWTNTEMPEKQRYFIMGNALVVHIIERIANELKLRV